MAENRKDGKFSGAATIDALVAALLSSVKTHSKSFQRVSRHMLGSISAGFNTSSAKGAMEEGGQSLAQSIERGLVKGLSTVNTRAGVWARDFISGFKANFARYKVSAAIISAPLIAAIDLAQDLRTVMVESADIMGDKYMAAAHSVNTMMVSVSMTQGRAVQLMETMSGLGLVNRLTNKDMTDLGVQVGRMSEFFGYNAQVLLKNYSALNRLQVSTKAFTTMTKVAYVEGKRQNLSLQEQEQVLGLVQEHMHRLGRSGDVVAVSLTASFSRALGVFKRLNTDIGAAVAGLQEMADYSGAETLKRYAMIAANSGRSVNDLMDMYENRVDEFVVASNEAATNYANRLMQVNGGLAAALDGTMDKIARSNIEKNMAAAFGKDHLDAYRTTTAAVRQRLQETEEYYHSIGRLAEFQANKEQIALGLYEEQLRAVKQRNEEERRNAVDTAKFDADYESLKATKVEIMRSLTHIAHALLVVVGGPLVRVLHEMMKMVQPIVDWLARGVVALSEAVNKSKDLQAVFAGLLLVAAGLLMPFLQVPILIGVAIKAVDEFLKSVVGVKDGLWGVLGMVADIGEAIHRFMWTPIFKTVGLIGTVIRKAMELVGIGGKDGGTGAMHDSITDVIKDEGHESRRRSSHDIEAVTKELQDMGRINQYSPYSKFGPERRLGSAPAAPEIAPPASTASNARAAEPAPRLNGGPDGLRGLLDRISLGEGTSDAKARAKGYNSGYDVTLGYGAYHRQTSKPISEMTLAEVKRLQDEMLRHPANVHNSSAVGKYQIVGKTLRSLQEQMGLRDDEVYSPETQERMARHLLKGRGLDKFLAGTMPANRFQDQLAQEWASVGTSATGRSAWGQHTGTSSAEIQSVLAVLRANVGKAPEAAPPRALALKPEMKETNDLLKQILEQQRTSALSLDQYQQLSMIHRQTSPKTDGGVTEMLASSSL